MFGPTSLTFPSQTVGAAGGSEGVAIYNTGTATLTLSIAVSGDFSQLNTCGASVPAGAGCSITVSFTPTGPGTRTGTMTLTDNASGSPQTVSLMGTGVTVTAFAAPSPLSFGNQTMGSTSASQAVMLTNQGAGALTITNIATSGDFALVGGSGTCPPPPPGGTVAAGGSCTVDVSFAPSALGTRTGTLTFSDNATNSPQTVLLGGTGVALPVTLSPSSLTFGSQMLGTASPSQTVTLSNSQMTALSITSMALAGANPGDFSQTNNCNASLSASGIPCEHGSARQVRGNQLMEDWRDYDGSGGPSPGTRRAGTLLPALALAGEDSPEGIGKRLTLQTTPAASGNPGETKGFIHKMRASSPHKRWNACGTRGLASVSRGISQKASVWSRRRGCLAGLCGFKRLQ